MRFSAISLFLILSICITGTAFGQTIEVALTCEKAKKMLNELSKAKDAKEISEISDTLGVTVLNSCDKPDGKVICYQCLDKDEKLRLLEIVLDTKSKRIKVTGYGCRCSDNK
jgi:hypothetical protein